MPPMIKKAIIVVDMQRDFMEGMGALPVHGTTQDFIEEVTENTRMLALDSLVLATQDWHTKNHVSFASSHPDRRIGERVLVSTSGNHREQMLWPNHCLMGSEGARIVVDNNLFSGIIHKGFDKRRECYSGFEDIGGTKTELHEILRMNGINRVIVYGVALDVCVKETVLSSLDRGYETIVPTRLCRGTNSDNSEVAIEVMKGRGAVIL